MIRNVKNSMMLYLKGDYDHRIGYSTYSALSRYLPVYAIPAAQLRPWPRDPVATSMKFNLYNKSIQCRHLFIFNISLRRYLLIFI